MSDFRVEVVFNAVGKGSAVHVVEEIATTGPSPGKETGKSSGSRSHSKKLE